MMLAVAAPGLTVRPATTADIPALDSLIARSARLLGRGFYTDGQTEAAIAHVFGVDSELVADGSYLVVEADGRVAGCGGWSRRPTLFGGDRYSARSTGALDPALDPARDAARIRAFFVSPDHARRGAGTMLLAACEDAARAHGFRRAALMATLPGIPFYRALGYVAGAPVTLDLDGTMVEFVPMDKNLVADIQQ
ncbi:GNAT family N-acetyltransferase [uncultured Sphingomonas sp.]|uniref:GNAT family N-acetyltransferase n=1 Tax=uncultured Sphingomonas sp. TaxID=158754 RepID=UPI0035CC3C3F